MRVKLKIFCFNYAALNVHFRFVMFYLILYNALCDALI